MTAQSSETLHTHNEATNYAATVDPEAERIKDYSRNVSRFSAERLTAASLGVIITVLNQFLRIDASIHKFQGEELALEIRLAKAGSQHFKMQYEGLLRAFLNFIPRMSFHCCHVNQSEVVIY